MSEGNDSGKPNNLMVRLSIMMFLQFFIWGAWFLTINLYLPTKGVAGGSEYYAFTAHPLAAMIAPFFIGLFADRFFNTEKLLGVLFLLSGVTMVGMSYIGELAGTPVAFADVDGAQVAIKTNIELFGNVYDKATVFDWLILAHMLAYMPTLGLTASLSFAHLKGNEDFPKVRLWGTIGWIMSGAVILSLVLKGERDVIQFYLAAAACFVLGVFCFTLPKTPAPSKGEKLNIRNLLFLDAISQLKNKNFFVFIFCSFLLCIPLQAYYANLQTQMSVMNMPYIAFMKNLGTIVEALMMFSMAFFFRKLGVKWMIAAGIGAWVLRYVLFAMGASQAMVSLVIFGILLHGICYDFFFVTGQIYVDKSTPEKIRGQAQSMLIFFTQGVGMYVGAKLNFGYLGPNAFKNEQGEAIMQNAKESLPYWPNFWWPLCALSAVILLIFVIFFKYKDDGNTEFSH